MLPRLWIGLPLAVLLLATPAYAADSDDEVTSESLVSAEKSPTTASVAPDRGPPLGFLPVFPNITFDQPTNLVEPDDGSSRFFVTEQSGRILVVPQAGEATEPTVFLDIRDRVSLWGWEDGLLGIALHPDFARNGYLYVLYSVADPFRTILSRFSVSGQSPDLADPESETVLLEITRPAVNHNGGQLAFGPDGYLYIAIGYGGIIEPGLTSDSNPDSLLGSILRIDVDVDDFGAAYRVPGDNPFFGSDWVRPEIWANGFRNPWRFSLDPESGLMWAGDPGEGTWEEIDIVLPGRHYGWSVMEGVDCRADPECDPAQFEMPVWAYTHEEGNCAVIGGYVYRGEDIALQGTYVFGDFCSGRIWGLKLGSLGVKDHWLLGTMGLAIRSFAQDNRGNLYVLAGDGKLYALTLPLTG